MTSALSALLEGVRRRLRLAWGLATGQLVAPAALGVALGLVVLGRLRPWPWTDAAAVTVVLVALLAVGVAAFALRVPVDLAARAADRGLHTGDVFATAVELESGRLPDGPLGVHVRSRAAALAAGRKAGDAVRLRLAPRRLALSGVTAVLAAGLALAPNHQDDLRRRREAEQALARAEAKELRKAAESLRMPGAPKAQSEAVRHLEDLARRLEQATTLDQARQAVDRTAATLGRGLSPGFLSEKAAQRGLERSLAARPLPGAEGSAADQLRQAAAALSGLTPEQQAKLAERLAALAASQAAGNADAARALEQAASGMRTGDAAGAAAALGEAAGAQESAASSVSGQEAVAQALGALAATQGRLAAGPPSGDQNASAGEQGQGQGGSGQGQGQGRGQGGSGQGGSRGQSQGPGPLGRGSGGPSGKVGGTNAPGGQGGRGGVGTPNGTGHNASVGLQEATVYDPAEGTDGEQLDLGGQPGQGPDRTTGKGQGPTLTGGTRVPLDRALPRYRAEATRALDTLDVPPSLRALVRAYFDSLTAEQP